MDYVISERKVQIDPAKIQAVSDWPTPTSSHDVQHFLRFANFYGKFFKNVSVVAVPLQALTSVKSQLSWSFTAEQALKSWYTSAAVLFLLNLTRQFVVEMEKSDLGIWVVSQIKISNNRMHPCAFLSRKLSSAKRNYDVGDQELLNIKVVLE